MARRHRKTLTQEEIEKILFNDTDESDFNSSDEDEENREIEDNLIQSSDSEGDKIEDDVCDNPNDDVEWESNVVCNENISIPKFTEFSGPVHSLLPGSSALDYLKLFLTDEICEVMRENTNKYAEYCLKSNKCVNSKWEPITSIQELWNFFSVLLVMSIVHMPRLTDYWSKNETPGNSRVKNLMSKNRFLLIKHFLHISDREKENARDSENFSYTQKLEPLQTYLKEKFSEHFKPYQNLSVDEALIKFKGRLGIIQYMPLKPAKRGIKIWMLCSSHLGYTLSFEMYCGKRDNTPRSNNGLGYDVVTHLVQNLSFKNHSIYFDRFFSSVVLMKNLLKLGIYSCGTVMPNRKNLPLDLKKLKLKSPHEINCYQCKQYPNLLCTTWVDKKQIHLLSTNSKNDCCLVQRRQGSEKKSVQCPVAFSNYNKNMGGVDLADQRRKYFSVSRKSSKWWWYVFSFFIDTAINNAYILHKITNSPSPKKTYQLYDFKLELIDELAKEGKRKRTHSDFSPTAAHIHKKRQIDGRKRMCVRCRKIKMKTYSGRSIESSFECEICKMCLCQSCFDCN